MLVGRPLIGTSILKLSFYKHYFSRFMRKRVCCYTTFFFPRSSTCMRPKYSTSTSGFYLRAKCPGEKKKVKSLNYSFYNRPPIPLLNSVDSTQKSHADDVVPYRFSNCLFNTCEQQHRGRGTFVKFTQVWVLKLDPI